MARAPVIIVSGPSGSGKSTLIKGALCRWPGQLRLAISATTRPPRPGEQDGRDYHFWTPDRFERAIAEGEFLEFAQVHGNNYYGTPRDEVVGWLEKGVGVFLDVDVQGAAALRNEFPDHLSVFVKLPALWWYCRRLEERGEAPRSIVRRLETALEELGHADRYQREIVNDDLKRATDELAELVRGRFDGLPPTAG